MLKDFFVGFVVVFSITGGSIALGSLIKLTGYDPFLFFIICIILVSFISLCSTIGAIINAK
jgi:hypothetical protein